MMMTMRMLRPPSSLHRDFETEEQKKRQRAEMDLEGTDLTLLGYPHSFRSAP